jgi:hypothetical protein
MVREVFSWRLPLRAGVAYLLVCRWTYTHVHSSITHARRYLKVRTIGKIIVSKYCSRDAVPAQAFRWFLRPRRQTLCRLTLAPVRRERGKESFDEKGAGTRILVLYPDMQGKLTSWNGARRGWCAEAPSPDWDGEAVAVVCVL